MVGWFTDWEMFERKMVAAQLKYYPGVCLEGRRKITKIQ
jgi:hypothetical protein